MWPLTHYLNARAVHADALFVSALQRSDEPDAAEVRRAMAESIRAFGCSGCAERMAQEFGDHPETAVIRMRWARMAVRAAYADAHPEPGWALDAPARSALQVAPARWTAAA
jgi:hypothetical protein